MDREDKRTVRPYAGVDRPEPTDSVVERVQILKGGTSRIILKEFPEPEEFLCRDSLWADGYFAEIVGQVDDEIIKRYID